MIADTASQRRVYAEGDPEMPGEFRQLLIRMLVHHIENSRSPWYINLLNRLWERCMTLAPDDRTRTAFARLMQQEVEHGAITARVLEGLGVDYVEQPRGQYLFDLPIETFCDLAYFHALGDRVGMYIGEEWEGIPYEPLLRYADRLHKDEVFHCTLGMRNLRRVCSTPEGREEASKLINKWWPAVLDMFGRSDSRASEAYVRLGLRKRDNEGLRQQYIADTRPLLEAIGVHAPHDHANRRYL